MVVRIPLKRHTVYAVFNGDGYWSVEGTEINTGNRGTKYRHTPIADIGRKRFNARGGKDMLLVLVVVLLLLSLGSFPAWPYSRGWGYYPSGGLGLVVLVLVILLLMGRI
jgi:Protein of unknown function (DUF3309)